LIIDHGQVVRNATRAVIVGNRRIPGLAADVISELVAEIGPLWHERHQARLASRQHKRAVGAGARYRLVFVDRLPATLVRLRHGVTHDVFACWFGVDRSTTTRAVGEVRPLLAERGCTIGPEIRVRRPAAGRKDRNTFISGKNKQNAVLNQPSADMHGRLAGQLTGGH
jgi:hypothetical protein